MGAIAVSRDCDIQVNEGVNLYTNGKLEEAYSKFEEVLKLCSNEPNAMLWKGKVELMLGRYENAIKTLQQVDSGEGKLWLSLALYLYSFLLDNPDREKAIQDLLYKAYSLIISRHDVELGSSIKSRDLAKLLFAVGLAELGKVNEAREFLSPRGKAEPIGPLLDMWHVYEAYFSGGRVDDKLESALRSIKDVSLVDKLLKGLLLDLVQLVEVRTSLKEKKYSEALSELSKVESPALKPLVLFYVAEAFEGLQVIGFACDYYREVFKFVDSPLVKKRLSRCSSQSPTGV